MASSPPLEAQAGNRRQFYVLGGVFGGITVLLAIGYLLFLSPHYVPLFTSLRPEDAAALTDALDKQGIAYRLADEGQTVLVPSDRADAARIRMEGSIAAARGAVGFELFNKSDMGLTSFAQKINYQRALQGELERTIMMEDGIEQARVHLALPERGLFQRDRAQPKAAVTILARPGAGIDAARIVGIQALVAASVPDLAAGEVVVLDGLGHVVSVSAPPASATLAPEIQARQGLEAYYAAQVRSIIDKQLPGIPCDVSAFVRPNADGAPLALPDAGPDPAGRDYRLRIVVQTASALSDEDKNLLTGSISDTLHLDLAGGDELGFALGLAKADAPPVSAPLPSSAALPKAGLSDGAAAMGTAWTGWIVGGLTLVLTAVAGLILLRRRQPAMLDPEERTRFAERLKQLLDNEVSHGAAE